jgi:type II secretory pathway component PulK
MSPIGTDSRRGRRGVALLVVALLVGMLSVFCLVATNYLVTSLRGGRRLAAETRAVGIAELGRADSVAQIVNSPTGPWPGRTRTTVTDDQGAAAGEYEFAVTDLRVLPEQNQQCLAEVNAWWPSQDDPAATSCRLRFWIEESGGSWTITAMTIDTLDTGG